MAALRWPAYGAASISRRRRGLAAVRSAVDALVMRPREQAEWSQARAGVETGRDVSWKPLCGYGGARDLRGGRDSP